jgi:hypothetical protein
MNERQELSSQCQTDPGALRGRICALLSERKIIEGRTIIGILKSLDETSFRFVVSVREDDKKRAEDGVC